MDGLLTTATVISTDAISPALQETKQGHKGCSIKGSSAYKDGMGGVNAGAVHAAAPLQRNVGVLIDRCLLAIAGAEANPVGPCQLGASEAAVARRLHCSDKRGVETKLVEGLAERVNLHARRAGQALQRPACSSFEQRVGAFEQFEHLGLCGAVYV